MKKVFYKGRFILIPLAAAAFLSVVSFAVMTLWNCLIPGIFGFSVITFWQAMGLFVLSKLLFGFGRGGGRGCGPCGGGRAPWMRWKMKERLAGAQRFGKEAENHPDFWQFLHQSSLFFMHPIILITQDKMHIIK